MSGGRPRPLLGVIFDLDGTVVDSGLDFPLLRREMGLGPEPILESMALLSPERRLVCQALLDRHEREGAERATLMAGAREWIDFLDQKGIPRALLSRNARATILRTLERVGVTFDLLFGREDAAPKPDPAGVVELCRRFGAPCDRVLVVGDFRYDLEAGRLAGAETALVTRGRRFDFLHLADHVWSDLLEGLAAARPWFDEAIEHSSGPLTGSSSRSP